MHVVSFEHLLVQEGREVNWMEQGLGFSFVGFIFFMGCLSEDNVFLSVFNLFLFCQELLLHNVILMVDLMEQFIFNSSFDAFNALVNVFK